MEKLKLMQDLKLLTNIVFTLSNNVLLSKKFYLANHKKIVSRFSVSRKTHSVFPRQMQRSICSVRLNIREGSIFWDSNKIRYFKMALGSLEETDESMEIAFEQRFITIQDHQLFKNQYLLCCNKLKKAIKTISQLASKPK